MGGFPYFVPIDQYVPLNLLISLELITELGEPLAAAADAAGFGGYAVLIGGYVVGYGGREVDANGIVSYVCVGAGNGREVVGIILLEELDGRPGLGGEAAGCRGGRSTLAAGSSASIAGSRSAAAGFGSGGLTVGEEVKNPVKRVEDALGAVTADDAVGRGVVEILDNYVDADALALPAESMAEVGRHDRCEQRY